MRKRALAALALASLAASGCRTAPPAGETGPSALRGIDFRAAVAAEGDAGLAPTMTIVNRRATPVLLSFPVTCYGIVRAYEKSGRTVPVWEQARDACPDGTVRVNLLAGEEKTVSLESVEASHVLGEDLPDGTYRFTVVVAPEGQVLEIEAGEEELAR